MFWNVIHKGKVIDVVSYDNGILADEVKKSLIDHDGYPVDIQVTAYTAPLYDTSYIAEKANMIIRGATEIIETINKPQTKNTRSYYVGGILDIEQALNGLHNQFRHIMAQCNETEDDYGLRHMGELQFGK